MRASITFDRGALARARRAGPAGPALADDAKPLAGKSITVLLPSPQGANIAADFEKATGIKVDLQTLTGTISAPRS